MIIRSFTDHKAMRKAALWFVIPASFCIAASFLDVIRETAFFTKREEVETSEVRFNELKQNLLPNTIACYISSDNSISAYYRAAYVLSPVLIKQTLDTKPPYLIYDCVDQTINCNMNFVSKGYRIKKDYKNGVKLYYRGNR